MSEQTGPPPETIRLPRCHDVKSVARVLSVSPKHVYHLCKTGQLGCLRVGGSVRITDLHLEAYLERANQGPDPAA